MDGTTINRWPGELGITLLRVFTGLSMAVAHGTGKMPPPPELIEAVKAIGLPLPTACAWAAALCEVVGGVLLAIGLFTRPAAACILFTMAVAAFAVHGGDSYGERELALLYGAVALAFLTLGSGRMSLDRALR